MIDHQNKRFPILSRAFLIVHSKIPRVSRIIRTFPRVSNRASKKSEDERMAGLSFEKRLAEAKDESEERSRNAGGRTAGKEGKKKESGRVERGAWRWQRLDPSQAAVG